MAASGYGSLPSDDPRLAPVAAGLPGLQNNRYYNVGYSILRGVTMKVIGIIFVLMALAIGIVPQFTNCSVQGRAIQLPDGRSMPMKCHWTANATPIIGVPLLVVGFMLCCNLGGSGRRGLSLLGSILGAFAILLPTSLIGVCASDEMLCRLAMEPALIFSGIVAVIAGLFGLLLPGKGQPSKSAGQEVMR